MMSSRERMGAALARETPDFVPCSFMIFTALRSQCPSQAEYVTRQLELGLDAVVEIPYRGAAGSAVARDLPGLPVTFSSEVKVKQWIERSNLDTFLHKTYSTPSGMLSTSVKLTEDWPYGEDVPLFDDYLIPRSTRFLVSEGADVAVLRSLLRPPTAEEICMFREDAVRMKAFAAEKGLLTSSGWGAGLEACCWLCGIRNLILLTFDRPGVVDELVTVIGAWNRSRMEVVLDAGVDLFVRRGWYEGTDFWSPDLFRRFVLPSLTREAALAHEAGARFGYIMTSGTLPLIDLIREAGVDVLIGIDPVMGKSADLETMREQCRGKVALWGGVNGFLTVERGSEQDVAVAVERALATLGPDGFVLSPVDNVRDPSPAVWKNVQALVRAWRTRR